MLQRSARDPDAETLGREMTFDRTSESYVGVTRTGTSIAVRRADFETVLPRYEQAKRPEWWLYNLVAMVVSEESGEGEWIYEVHDSEEGIYTGGSRLTHQDAYQFGNDALEQSTVQLVQLYERNTYVQTLRRPSPEDRVRGAGVLQRGEMLEEREREPGH